jgi:hypothetical protein
MLKSRLIEHLEKFETLDLKKVLIKLPYVPLDTNHDDSRYPIEKDDLIGYMQYNWPDREINQTLKELGFPTCDIEDISDESTTEPTFHDKVQLQKKFLEKTETGKALYALGYSYATGFENSLPKDQKEAFRWYFLSAKKGYPVAQCKVGFAYVLGKQIEKDWAVGHMWLSISANQGFNRARRGLNVIEPLMTQEELEKSQKLREILEPFK